MFRLAAAGEAVRYSKFLGCLIRMELSLDVMPMRQVSMVPRLNQTAGLVMLGGLFVMIQRVLMVLSGKMVLFVDNNRHDWFPLS
jgi:hypothetical protein